VVHFASAIYTRGNAADAACRALKLMCAVEGVSIGVATRLLALARPDVCVSVNGGSAPGLAKISGRSFTSAHIQNPENYQQVLDWVARQPWYKAQRPTDALETVVWDMRAALVDWFVYEPV
jgi:hypothetical protein